MTDEPIRVLLVEDNDVYRESLVFLLGRRDGIEVAGAVATGEAAARACAVAGAHVAIVDYRLPDIDGSEVADDIRRAAPGTAVVFLSASAGRDEEDAARSAGAALVRKDQGVDALVEAVRVAARGEGT